MASARGAVAALLLLALAHGACARMVLSEECPGNLIVNGDFEVPDTTKVPTQVPDPSSNPRWAWYKHRIPGWYTTRADGKPCVVVDWAKPHIEISQGALATPIEGKQYAELLPNATGNYCQDIKVTKGAQYRLSYYYGRLMTFFKGTGRFTEFDTAVDVAVRPADYVPRSPSRWPGDKQGFTQISSADTAAQWAETKKQWVRHEVTFTAPSDTITLAFINAKRPKECGSCGSLLDAICLQKV